MGWWLALVALVIGVIGGFVLARSGDSNRRKAADLQAQLDTVNTELDDYRQSVTRHFSRTAELVDALAANSREIYKHLAEGSEKLCDSGVVKLGKDNRPGLTGEAKRPSRQATTADPDGEDIQPNKPDDGWYEILPENDEQRSASGKTDKRKAEEPAL